jgi:single-strand DNA-binding protein
MADLNKWIASGRLTAKPELKKTQNGTSVTSFTIALNRRPNQDGTTTADFINCVAWRGTAEFICNYFDKGRMISVVGSMRNRSWTDQSGNKRTVTEALIDEAYFTGEKKEQQPGQTQNTYMPSSYTAPQTAPQSAPVAPQFEVLEDEEELPF